MIFATENRSALGDVEINVFEDDKIEKKSLLENIN